MDDSTPPLAWPPPPLAWPAPRHPAVPPPPAVRAPTAAQPLAGHSPVAGLSAQQWQAARDEAARFHAARQRAAMWTAPTAPTPRGPSAKHRRRAAVVATLSLAGIVTAATGMVLLRHEPAQAYSLDAAAMRAEHVNTLSYEFETSTTDGTTTSAEVDMDIDNGLVNMTMDDGSGEQWQYIYDLDRNRMYAAAEQFADMGFDVDDAHWVSFELDDMLDEDEMGAVYWQAGENPLDATMLFDVADEVDDLGFDQVRGERVKHYEVIVDEDAVIGSKHATHGFVNDGEVDPEGKDIYDVYVNESNQIVRLSYDYEMLGQWASVDLTVTGTDERVDITVPKRSDVVAFDDIEFSVDA